ncbi:hypothetical protein E2C01_099006 [Portunus trituberculatus]|uniref:Uncharacterized protein n=1 Tax=Portunus trituberculatus TaxID=210409 RepID=A0A5B7K8F6_PORTR|nr:hypothetical protein [Portunus trituberculatus]
MMIAQDLLESHAESLSNDELIKLDKVSQEVEKEGDEEEEPPVKHAIPVTPAKPATAGPSSISSFFKPVKRANPATADPSTSASDSADDDVISSSVHSVEYE